MGADGAMVVANGEVVTIPAFKVPEVVDVTGAGDLFASGFLLALSRERPLETALRLGCLAASEVIGHIGARPLADLRTLAGAHALAV
jgi:sugar/nucleoside kinase (ribokinase family)